MKTRVKVRLDLHVRVPKCVAGTTHRMFHTHGLLIDQIASKGPLGIWKKIVQNLCFFSTIFKSNI